MKIKSSRRLVKRLGLALAVAAVFAPNAQAIPAGMEYSTSTSDAVQVRQYADDIRVAPPVRKYADDPVRGQVDGNHTFNPLAQPAPKSTDESSFSIGYDPIGVVGAAFLALGLGALLVTVRHSRRGRLAAA
jgi:hypothetical protein